MASPKGTPPLKGGQQGWVMLGCVGLACSSWLGGTPSGQRLLQHVPRWKEQDACLWGPSAFLTTWTLPVLCLWCGLAGLSRPPPDAAPSPGGVGYSHHALRGPHGPAAAGPHPTRGHGWHQCVPECRLPPALRGIRESPPAMSALQPALLGGMPGPGICGDPDLGAHLSLHRATACCGLRQGEAPFS